MAKESTPVGEEQTKVKINRREFLNIAWLASLGFLTVNVAGITYLFAMPRFKEGEFGGVYTFGKVADLPATDAAPQNIPKVKMWMSNSEEGVLAIYGPFNYNGTFTSESNARFDAWLKSRDPASGVRDFEAVDALARARGLVLQQDVAMPANNRTLVWHRTKQNTSAS